jgi:hypothetical protein
MGTSTFAVVATNAITTDVANVNTIAPATAGGTVNLAGDVSVAGTLRVLGGIDTVNARNLDVRDKVVTLGSVDADDNGVPDLDDTTRDGAGIVVAGVPANFPANKDPANYEHSLTWNAREGDFLPGGIAQPPHKKPLWRLKGGGLSIVSEDTSNRQAEFYFAPHHDMNRATLGLYYGVDDGQTCLVHTFDAPTFPQPAPSWRTSGNLVACLSEDRPRSFVAYRASSYALLSGTLPYGTDLSPEGVLTGAATVLGHYEFTVRAASADAHSDRDFVYRVLPPAPFGGGNEKPRWTTRQVDIRPVPDGCGLAIQFDAWDPYQVATYNDAVSYSVLSGDVPEGCIMSESGILSTTGRVRRGSYTFTARAYSRASHLYSDKSYTIVVVPPPGPSASVEGVLTSNVAGSIDVNVADALAVFPTVEFYAYVSVHQDSVPDSYWALGSVAASGEVLTVNFSGPEAMTYRPANAEALLSPVTVVSAKVGSPVTLRFYPLQNFGQLRIPRDLGDMNADDPAVSTTDLNGDEYVARASFTAAQGSPGACCNGGFVRSASTPEHWAPRELFMDYVGPTITQSVTQTLHGEYMEVVLPASQKVTAYTFDPTVSDVPSSWTLLGRTAFGPWNVLDSKDDVAQPLSETDYGTQVSDVAADRVYSFQNTTAYRAYRIVVRSTTGLVGGTFHLSGFSLVINPASPYLHSLYAAA